MILTDSSEVVFSPIYYDSTNSQKKFSCKSLYQINEEEKLNDVVLKRQPNWKVVHKDDIGTMSTARKIYILFKPALLIVLITYILFNVIFIHGVVPSESMESTIMTGEFLFSNKLAYTFSEPRRGDIVVFKNLDEPTLLIKRIIGVPGDTIEFFNGNVYINGCKLVENYTQGKTYQLKNDRNKFVVPEGNVFLLGDNRENSLDSRAWEHSFVPYDKIEGKAIIKYSFEKGKILPNFQLIQSEEIKFQSDFFTE